MMRLTETMGRGGGILINPKMVYFVIPSIPVGGLLLTLPKLWVFSILKDKIVYPN